MDQPAEPLRPRRRTVLAAVAAAPFARVLVPGAGSVSAAAASAAPAYRFLTQHQAAVVIAATARLAPGPLDDPAEIGHPGAREAGVVHFVDRLLSAFDDHPPHVFAGGPWSDRHAAGPDHLADFLPLHERQRSAWRQRVVALRHDVAASVVRLDAAATDAGYADFPAAPTIEQDRILAADAASRDVLFSLTIDAMYSVPEYGGNAGLTAWREIEWPGDRQPVGYTKAAVESDDGIDPIAAGDLPVVREVLAALPALGRSERRRSGRRG